MSVQEVSNTPEMSVVPFLGIKTSILDLCLLYHFSVDSLAFIAEVDVQVMYDMFGYKPVCKVDAQKVLDALSELLERTCTFENMDVPLFEDGKGEGEGESNGQAQIS